MTIDSKALEAADLLLPCPCGHFQPTQMMAREICRDMASSLWQSPQTRVWCLGCGATIIKATASDAIAAWNRRALPSPKVEEELVRYEIIDHTGCIHYANDAEHAEKLRQTLVHSSPVLADEGVTTAARFAAKAIRNMLLGISVHNDRRTDRPMQPIQGPVVDDLKEASARLSTALAALPTPPAVTP